MDDLGSATLAPCRIYLDGDDVLFSASDGVHRIPKSGAVASTVLHAGGTRGVVADATHYFIDTADGIHTINKATDEVTLLASATGETCLASDDTHVYYVSQKTVFKVAKTGGTPVPLTDGTRVKSCIAVDSTHVYWSGRDGIGAASHIGRAPKNGGVVEVLYETNDLSGIECIALGAQPNQTVRLSAGPTRTENEPSLYGGTGRASASVPAQTSVTCADADRD